MSDTINQNATAWDSDGVFYDFNAHAYNFLGIHPKTVGDQKFWEVANQTEGFWETMPLIPGAVEFWEEIEHLSPTVITGAPKGNFVAAANAKKAAWKRDFNHDDVIVCLSKHKQLHMKNPGDILIDDTARNCRRWVDAGGIAILHTSFDNTRAELQRLSIL